MRTSTKHKDTTAAVLQRSSKSAYSFFLLLYGVKVYQEQKNCEFQFSYMDDEWINFAQQGIFNTQSEISMLQMTSYSSILVIHLMLALNTT